MRRAFCFYKAVGGFVVVSETVAGRERYKKMGKQESCVQSN